MLIMALVTVPVWAEAGLSEAVWKRAFWVVAPFALEQADGNANDVTLFAGHESKWYDYWALSDIEHIGWNAWDVENIKGYGTHGRDIYGATNDGRWFIAHTSGGVVPWYYDDESEWRDKVTSRGGNPGKLLTFEQGYRASRLSLWSWRICKVVAVVAIFLLGWIAARFRYKKANLGT
jgi:hypothetical protein